MYPHHAFHRELAHDRQTELLREARVDHVAAAAEAEVDSVQLASVLSPAAGLVAAWLRRGRAAHLRPALHRAV